jgi:hypothetical protein
MQTNDFLGVMPEQGLDLRPLLVAKSKLLRYPFKVTLDHHTLDHHAVHVLPHVPPLLPQKCGVLLLWASHGSVFL